MDKKEDDDQNTINVEYLKEAVGRELSRAFKEIVIRRQSQHSETSTKDQHTSDSDYLKMAVGRQLTRALAEVAISRSERPIEYLANYLIAFHERELELQRNITTELKQPPRTASDAVSSEERVIIAVITDIVDHCAERESLQMDTFSDVDESMLEDKSDLEDRKSLKQPSRPASDNESNEEQIIISVLTDVVDHCAGLGSLQMDTFSDDEESMLEYTSDLEGSKSLKQPSRLVSDNESNEDESMLKDISDLVGSVGNQRQDVTVDFGTHLSESLEQLKLDNSKFESEKLISESEDSS